MKFNKETSRVEQEDGSLGPPVEFWRLFEEIWKMLKELIDNKEK